MSAPEEFEDLIGHIERLEPLPRPESVQRHAERVALNVRPMTPEEVATWARRLAEDVAGADD